MASATIEISSASFEIYPTFVATSYSGDGLIHSVRIGGHSGTKESWNFSNDTAISSANPDTNYALDTTVVIEEGNSLLVRPFPVWTIPSNIKVIRARLVGTNTGSGGSGARVKVKRTKISPLWITSQATWNNVRDGIPWEVPGAKGVTDTLLLGISDVVDSTVGEVTVLESQGLVDYVQETSILSSFAGLLIESYQGSREFNTQENTNTSWYLEVFYQNQFKGPIITGYIDADSGGTAVSSLTFSTSGAGIQEGELLVAVCGSNSSLEDFNGLSGWTTAFDIEAQGCQITVLWKVAGASESDVIPTWGSTGQRWGFLYRIIGADLDNPIGASTATSDNTGTPTALGFTSLDVRSIALAVFSCDGGNSYPFEYLTGGHWSEPQHNQSGTTSTGASGCVVVRELDLVFGIEESFFLGIGASATNGVNMLQFEIRNQPISFIESGSFVITTPELALHREGAVSIRTIALNIVGSELRATEFLVLNNNYITVPDATVSSANISAPVIDEDNFQSDPTVDPPSGNYTVWDGSGNSVVRVSFFPPQAILGTGFLGQRVICRLEKSAIGGNDPTFSFDLYDGTTVFVESGTATLLDNATYFLLDWDAGELPIDPTGFDFRFECIQISGGSGGNPGNRRGIDFASMRWLQKAYTQVYGATYIITGSEVDTFAGADETLDAVSLSFSLTGSTVSTLQNYKSAIGSGSFSITGSSVDTLKTFVSEISTGSFALTGQAVDTLYNRRSEIGTGSFVLAGSLVGTLQNYLSQIGTIALNITASTVGTSRLIVSQISSGTFALAGGVVDSLYHRVSEVISGSFTLVGNAVDTIKSFVSQISSGSLVLSGSSIDSLYSRRSAIDSGSFVITGNSVLTSRVITSELGTGSFALTGSTVDTIYNPEIISEISSGSFSLIGALVDTLRNYTSAISSGAFSLTGAAAATVVSFVSQISSGSFIWNGSLISTVVNHRSAISSGSFSLTGSSVDTLRNITSQISTGSFALTGASVASIYNRRSEISAGAFALSGATVTTQYNRRSEIGAGTFVLAGSNVSTIKSFRSEISAGAFALSGSTVSTTRIITSQISTGTFALTGSAVTTIKTFQSEISSGSFVLSGSTVDNIYHRRSEISAGSFALSGNAVSTLHLHETQISTGTFALTGSVVDLLRGYTSDISIGTFSLSGSTIDTIYNSETVIDIVSGSFALTGNVVDTLRGYTSEIDSIALNITGASVTTLYNRKSLVDSGTFAVIGTSVDLVYTRISQIDSGAFDLTGSVVSTLNQRVSQISSGNIVLDGSTVNSIYHRRSEISAGAFALTGSTVNTVKTFVSQMASGAFVVSGSTITLLTNLVSGISSGSLILTGDTVGLQAGKFIAEGGIFDLIGSPVSTLKHHISKIGSLVINLSPSNVGDGAILPGWIGSGWARSCALEVFSLGWIRCSDLIVGGIVNISDTFPTGGAVTITLYNPTNGALVPLTSNVCTEIGTTGVYVWDTVNLSAQPTEYTEYAYVMSDGTIKEGGIKVLHPNDIDTVNFRTKFTPEFIVHRALIR